MEKIRNLNIQVLKSKFQVRKPWDIVIISILNILLTIPTFIVLHQLILDPDWIINLDRILLFLIVLLFYQILLHLLRTIIIICIAIYLVILFVGTVFGRYGFLDISEDYQSMLFTMNNNPNPQDIIISRLMPFPNKNKIMQAIDYQNPKVRNFALMATTKHFKNTKKFVKRRQIIQCFAVFAEIQQRWNYVNDPKGREYIAFASESLQHFSGDCDDHAILMCAGIRAVGGTPRIISTSDHFYPEILIGTKKDFEAVNFIIKKVLFAKQNNGKNLNYHIDERGNIWLNMDYTAKYPGGPFMSEEILGALTLN